MNSCRKGPKIKHVQYKCTMCFKTVVLFFCFISLKSRISQTSCFNIRSPRHEFERSRLSISFSDEGKSEMEINLQLLQTILIL